MDFSTNNISLSSAISPSVFNICQDMPTGFTVYFTVLMTDVTVGLPLSIWVMVLLTHSKKGCTVSDVFAFNLAVMQVVNFCFAHMWLYNYYIFKSDTLLTALSFCLGSIWFGPPLFKCCICLERYLAVVHPIVYFKYKALRSRLACATCIWLFIIAIGVFFVNYTDTSNNMITAIYVPVLAAESFSSLSILRALRQAQPGGKERQEMNLMKRRAFITVLVIQIATMINYFPVMILNIFRLFSSSLYSTCMVTPIWMCFTEIGSFVHPLLYLFRPGRLPSVKNSWSRDQKKHKSSAIH